MYTHANNLKSAHGDAISRQRRFIFGNYNRKFRATLEQTLPLFTNMQNFDRFGELNLISSILLPEYNIFWQQNMSNMISISIASICMHI